MRRRKPFLPYQQGQLDGLCGIYAIINAIRLAARNTDASRLEEEDWGELFHVLLGAADGTVGAVTIAVAGIEPKPLARLLPWATRHMADQHDVSLRISRPLRAQRRALFRNIVGKLAAISSEPHSALLVCFSGHLNHWTVVRKVGNNTLELFDSDGLLRVRLANCRMSHERGATYRREHVLSARSVFHIIVEPRN